MRLVRGLVVVSAVCLLYATADRHSFERDIERKSRAINETTDDVYPIVLTGTKEGVRIEFVYEKAEEEPAPLGIHVTTPQVTFTLRDVDGLEGLVHITDARTALKLVRLPTEYLYTFPSRLGVEIRQEDTGKRKYLDDACVLSAADFRKGGFTLPVVEKQGSSFVITRWIYVQGEKEEERRVRKVRETVGEDASYRRMVLEERPVPDLDDERLIIYGRK
jgi:hypothetical protein